MSSEFNEISQFIEATYPLNKNGLRELLELFNVNIFKKGSQVLKTNQTEKQLRFLNNGVIKEYHTTLEKKLILIFILNHNS